MSLITKAVVSIPHTGTHFLCEVLGHPRSWHLTDDGIIDALSFEGQLIVPLRKPERVMWSWEKRGRDKSEWGYMWPSLYLLDAFFFFLDEPSREEQLKDLSRLLRTPLETDWEPINTQGPPGEITWDSGLSRTIYDRLRNGNSTGYH